MIDLVTLLVSFGSLIGSIVIHEVAHGLVAERLGDETARRAGRLTLNPLKHLDVLGSLVIPAILIFSGSGIVIGWAKPVPIHPDRFDHPRVDEVTVALAGPIANLLVAVAGAILLRASGEPSSLIGWLVVPLIHLNLVLAVFNLLPLPPLDGSKLLGLFLPEPLARAVNRANPIVSVFLLFAVLNLAPVTSWLQQTTTLLTRLLVGG
jgi:Zn-dependent protease